MKCLRRICLLILLAFCPLSACQLVVMPETGGVVISASGLHDCISAPCEFEAQSGLTDDFTAVPNEGYRFAGWEGACEGEKSCAIAIPSAETLMLFLGFAPDSDIALIANFALIESSQSPDNAFHRLNGVWRRSDGMTLNCNMDDNACTLLELGSTWLGLVDLPVVVGDARLRAIRSVDDSSFTAEQLNLQVGFDARTVRFSFWTNVSITFNNDNSFQIGSRQYERID